VLVPENHRLATTKGLTLGQLADEQFVMFPRDLAPRLYDALFAICRAAGFEPDLSRRAFHSAGDMGTLTSAGAIALAPDSVREGIPGMVAIPLTEDSAQLETFLMWRPDTPSAAAERFRELALSTFTGW
jgi:DNA-binding transcriptional LysR family regulator